MARGFSLAARGMNKAMIFCSNGIGINLDRQRYGAVKGTEHSLPPMHAGVLVVVHGFLAGETDIVFLCLDLQIALCHTRQFDDGNEIISFLKDVDGGKRPSRLFRPASSGFRAGTLEHVAVP
jgi:hypothetical protein